MKNSGLSRKKILLLGSGELGKELVIEAKRLGCEVIAIDKYPNAPAMQVADSSYVVDMTNKIDLKNIIQKSNPDYVVPEIEAISISALKEMEDLGVNIIPNARTVELTMNRDKIRDLASNELKIKTANFNYVFNYDDLKNRALEIGFPLLIKPLMSSSGKGQSVVNNEENLLQAWNNALKNSRGNIKGVILEEFIKFDYEFTLLSVRTKGGKNIFCSPIGHEQIDGDYQSSWQPLEIGIDLYNEAKEVVIKILDNLDGAGIYGVEFFVRNNELIFSELSPRPHDTGMVTLISQDINEFELHLRAFLDLPIPKIQLLNPSASKVILSEGQYSKFYYSGIREALEINNSKVFIFGKDKAKLKRRMGVALASGENLKIARLRADECASKIRIKPFVEE